MLEIGSLVDGKYRILHKVGEGGMSVVYMAMVERANKTWAIKEIRRDGVQDFETIRQGLRVEAELLKTLHHKYLPSIVDIIDTEDSFLVVMDFIEGRTLRAVLEEEGPQPQEKVIHWAKQLCEVLGYLHEQKIIYRDMKPGNIMLKPDGDIVLFDFGTARKYKGRNREDTTCLGTRGYAAPEQYGGCGESDIRTDIYCLGATLYHLLTGHNPGLPPYEMYPIRQWNPTLSAGLEAIILTCIRKDPEERYSSCDRLQYALEHYWESDAAYGRQQKAKFFRFLLPAGCAILFGLAAGIFWGLRIREQNRTYEAYLEAAGGALTQDEEIENYKHAIAVDPVRTEAYMRLLQDTLVGDGILTSGESEILREIMISHPQGRSFTAQELFRSHNPAGYARFAYEAGLDYFYRFQEKENKKSARSYFAFVKEYGARWQMDEAQVDRACRLYEISDYYGKIGVTDAAGDEEISYGDYWKDLVAVSEGNLVEEDNERTAIVVYGELVFQMIANTGFFRRAGITKEEMELQLSRVRSHLYTDFGSGDEAIQQEVKKVRSALIQAEDAVTSAYTQYSEIEEVGVHDTD